MSSIAPRPNEHEIYAGDFDRRLTVSDRRRQLGKSVANLKAQRSVYKIDSAPNERHYPQPSAALAGAVAVRPEQSGVAYRQKPQVGFFEPLSPHQHNHYVDTITTQPQPYAIQPQPDVLAREVMGAQATPQTEQLPSQAFMQSQVPNDPVAAARAMLEAARTSSNV